MKEICPWIRELYEVLCVVLPKNEALSLAAILVGGALTRDDLCRLTGLNRNTMYKILRSLRELSVVVRREEILTDEKYYIIGNLDPILRIASERKNNLERVMSKIEALERDIRSGKKLAEISYN